MTSTSNHHHIYSIFRYNRNVATGQQCIGRSVFEALKGANSPCCSHLIMYPPHTFYAMSSHWSSPSNICIDASRPETQMSKSGEAAACHNNMINCLRKSMSAESERESKISKIQFSCVVRTEDDNNRTTRGNFLNNGTSPRNR